MDLSLQFSQSPAWTREGRAAVGVHGGFWIGGPDRIVPVDGTWILGSSALRALGRPLAELTAPSADAPSRVRRRPDRLAPRPAGPSHYVGYITALIVPMQWIPDIRRYGEHQHVHVDEHGMLGGIIR